MNSYHIEEQKINQAEDITSRTKPLTRKRKQYNERYKHNHSDENLSSDDLKIQVFVNYEGDVYLFGMYTISSVWYTAFIYAYSLL